MAIAEILIAPTGKQTPDWEVARIHVQSLSARQVEGNDKAFDERLLNQTQLRRAKAQGMRAIELESQARKLVDKDIDALAELIRNAGGSDTVQFRGGSQYHAERACAPAPGKPGAFVMRGLRRPVRDVDLLAPYWRVQRLIAAGVLPMCGYLAEEPSR